MTMAAIITFSTRRISMMTKMTMRLSRLQKHSLQQQQQQRCAISVSAFGSVWPQNGISREYSVLCIPGRNSYPRSFDIRVEPHHFVSPSFRWFSSSSSLSSSEKATDENTNNNAISPYYQDVDYVSPLGGLITRLKMVSITGCFLSVCVMPALVFLKNGDLPNAQQATMGGIATLGAIGSTAALHFVFGAYVLELKTVVPTNDTDETSDDDDDDDDDKDDVVSSKENKWLLEATTRSVFGFWKNTHVFDPTRDVGPYRGSRPFANFCADGVPLYVHPEKLDAITKKWLLQSQGQPVVETSETGEAGVHEGIPATTTATKKKAKKFHVDDDELF